MNLIDRDALAKALGIKEKCVDCKRNISVYRCAMGSEFAWACGVIFDAPVIEQPEIIHCEECKYCKRENVTYVYADGTEQEVLDRYINCTKERYQPEVRLDDFCSRAERREDAVRKSDC